MSAEVSAIYAPMAHAEALTFGVEEEFFIVDLRTGRAPGRVPKTFVKTCQRR